MMTTIGHALGYDEGSNYMTTMAHDARRGAFYEPVVLVSYDDWLKKYEVPTPFWDAMEIEQGITGMALKHVEEGFNMGWADQWQRLWDQHEEY